MIHDGIDSKGISMNALKHVSLALATVGVLASGVAKAALNDRGGGLIYDSDLNITWLADANYAKTSGYDADGLMNWSAANTWAANLVYHDSVRNVDYSDWRLPTVPKVAGQWCTGYNCTSSELGHLYYIEGGLSAGSSISASATLNNYFFNKKSFYWFGTIYAPGISAFNFITAYGNEGGNQGGNIALYAEYSAWAVRPGDVAAVPEPETYAMMLTGLALLGFAQRSRKQQANA